MALVLALALAAQTAVSAFSAAARAGAANPTTPAAGLTSVERRALAIRSLTVVHAPSRGLIATVTFGGDIERYLGQGGLRQAVLALVLVPRAPGAPGAGVLDGAGGFLPAHLPTVARRGGRLAVTRQTVDLFGHELVLNAGVPGHVAVLRAGDRVVFILNGAALTRFRAVRLVVLAASPALGRRLSPGAWGAILHARPTALASAPLDQAEATCAQMTAQRSGLSNVIAPRLQAELRSQRLAHGTLTTTLSHYRLLGPGVARSTISRALAATSGRIARVQGESATLHTLSNQLTAASKRACAPPPSHTTQIPAPTTPTTPATTTTTTTTTAPPPPPPVQVVQTNPVASQFMAAQPGLTLSSTQPQGVPIINVDEHTRYQQFGGIGGALTDSSAWLIANKMSTTQRAALMQDLFGPPGSGTGLAAPPIHLGFVRVGVAATGAMTETGAYSYDDNDPGHDLTPFSIQHDLPYIIPTLQQALAVNPALQILASPWSSPGWMKSNGSLDNSNNSGTLIAADYNLYARYLVKFIQAYQSQGIPIAAITPANEPTSSTPYPGLNLPESGEAQLIAQNLKPALTAANLNTKIYGNDLSWDQFTRYASPLAADTAAGPDLAGIAWHCYFGSPGVMTQLAQQSPRMDQIVDECSPEIRSFGTPEFLISTLRNWASVDSIWSIALDPAGNPVQTPNHCGNCRGAVSIDQTTGNVTFRPEYYQLGQVSAFVTPGATRIDSPTLVTYGTDSSNIETVTSGLDDVAFLNPDGSKVLVAYNNSSAPISFAVSSDGSYFTYTIPAQTMTTFVWH